MKNKKKLPSWVAFLFCEFYQIPFFPRSRTNVYLGNKQKKELKKIAFCNIILSNDIK